MEVTQGPCKENQKSLVNAKVVDSSREFLNLLSSNDNLPVLGFVPNDENAAEGEDDLMDVMDEFLSKISVILLSLLEGEEDHEIC